MKFRKIILKIRLFLQRWMETLRIIVCNGVQSYADVSEIYSTSTFKERAQSSTTADNGSIL